MKLIQVASTIGALIAALLLSSCTSPENILNENDVPPDVSGSVRGKGGRCLIV